MRTPTREQLAVVASRPAGRVRIEKLREEMEQQHAKALQQLEIGREAIAMVEAIRDTSAQVLADIAAVTGEVRA